MIDIFLSGALTIYLYDFCWCF